MEKSAWVVSVNMGYGHQRTAFPLRSLSAKGKVICANSYQGIPKRDKRIWGLTRAGYEFVSRVKAIPLFGSFVFFLFDQFQKILSFYPERNLSVPSFQLKQTFSLIKKGWGRHFIVKLAENPLPIVSTFFTPAFMAEYFNYPGEIFCVVCDADISRAWAPPFPEKSRIKYFAPNSRVVERLKLYGVKEENIFLTGYPLPLENIGGKDLNILKNDIKRRILNLDPKKRYSEYYEPLVRKYLGKMPSKSDHPLTLMFAVGGAGSQKEIGALALKSLSKNIKKGKMKMILVAGTSEKVKRYFKEKLSAVGLSKSKNIEILFDQNINKYFKSFNAALRKTDILWTKPSELSFYSALGIPIIIAPSIGSQEDFNKRWLLKSGFGNLQENPSHADQWLSDWLEKGYLAEAAMQGFIEGEKLGAFNIKEIIGK